MRRYRSPSLEQISRHIATGKPATLRFPLFGERPKHLVVIHVRMDRNLDTLKLGCATIWGYEPSAPEILVEIDYQIKHRLAMSNTICIASALASEILDQSVGCGVNGIDLVSADDGLRILANVEGHEKELGFIPREIDQDVLTRFRAIADSQGPHRQDKGIIQRAVNGSTYNFAVTETGNILHIEITKQLTQSAS